jgi:SAM-dependent methyltransferase
LQYYYLDFLSAFGVGGAHPGGLQLTKQILARESIHQETSVLDVGCGTGQTSAYIAEKYGCSVTSLDNHNIMLKKAEQRFSSLHLPIHAVYGSVEELPFQNEVFDYILSESVTTFTDASLTVREFKRVLKPNGVLLAIEMVLQGYLSEEESETIGDFYRISQFLTESEWLHLFQTAGFSQITAETYRPSAENDIEAAPDFLLSENIDEKLLEILEKHKILTTAYQDKLWYCIFRCCV